MQYILRSSEYAMQRTPYRECNTEYDVRNAEYVVHSNIVHGTQYLVPNPESGVQNTEEILCSEEYNV
eukprot:2696351-Lingulodinium_polyedra.AAC.1